MHWAKSRAAQCSVTLTLRQGVRVEEDEQVDRAIAPILAVVPFELARCGRDRLGRPAHQLGRALVEAHYRDADRIDGKSGRAWGSTESSADARRPSPRNLD